MCENNLTIKEISLSIWGFELFYQSSFVIVMIDLHFEQ